MNESHGLTRDDAGAGSQKVSSGCGRHRGDAPYASRARLARHCFSWGTKAIDPGRDIAQRFEKIEPLEMYEQVVMIDGSV